MSGPGIFMIEGDSVNFIRSIGLRIFQYFVCFQKFILFVYSPFLPPSINIEIVLPIFKLIVNFLSVSVFVLGNCFLYVPSLEVSCHKKLLK